MARIKKQKKLAKEQISVIRKIEDVRERVVAINELLSIEGIVEWAGLELGRNNFYYGLDRDERTPSMKVHNEYNYLKDFGNSEVFRPYDLIKYKTGLEGEQAQEVAYELIISCQYSRQDVDDESSAVKEVKALKDMNKIRECVLEDRGRVENYLRKQRGLNNGYDNLIKMGFSSGVNKDNNIIFDFKTVIIELGGRAKYINHGRSSKPITFNLYANEPYYIVEGFVNGLSALEMGFNAVVLNGVANANKFKPIRGNKYIIAVDKDKAGWNALLILEKILKKEEFEIKYSEHYRGDILINDLNDYIKAKKPMYTSKKIDKHIEPKQLVDVFNNSDRMIILESPTGSGKTTSICNYTLNESIKQPLTNCNKVYIFAMPLKMLAKQVGNNFDHVQCIVGGVKVDLRYNTFAVVYDKVKEVVNTMLDHGKEIILIIDEAHELAYAEYRKKTIDTICRIIFNLRNDISKEHKVILVTATPRVLEGFNVDKVISFKRKGDSGKPKHTKVHCVSNIRTSKERATREGYLIKLIEKEKECNDIVIVMCDDKDLQRVICSEFDDFKMINSDIIKSIDKNGIDYKDNTYSMIIEQGTVNTHLIATSCLNCGVSLRFDDNIKVGMIYHIKKKSAMQVDKIRQAMARVRTGLNRFVIVSFDEKNEAIEPFERIKLRTGLNILKGQKVVGEYYEHILHNDDVQINRLLKFFLNDTNMLGYKYGYGKISLDDLRVSIMNQNLVAIKEYDKQLCNNGKELLKSLELEGDIFEVDNYLRSNEFSDIKSENKERNKEEWTDFVTEFNKLSQLLDVKLSSFLDVIDREDDPIHDKFNGYKIGIEQLFKLVKSDRNISIYEVGKILNKCPRVSDLEKVIQVIKYERLHKEYEININRTSLTVAKEYLICRKHLKIDTHITDSKLNKIMKDFEKERLFKNYLMKPKNGEDTSKYDKELLRRYDIIKKQIGLIFVVKNDRITSLNTLKKYIQK